LRPTLGREDLGHGVVGARDLVATHVQRAGARISDGAIGLFRGASVEPLRSQLDGVAPAVRRVRDGRPA
jgi:hypothetical protein